MKGLSAGCLALIVLVTFPFWIAIMVGGFGVVIGIVGAIIGAIAGLFGAIVGLIGAILEGIFGGIFNWHGPHIHFPHFHMNGFVIAALIITLALVAGRKKAK